MDLLNKLNFTGMPLHHLKIKKNSICMVLRNLNLSMGVCNGTRVKII